jgi:predicted nucleotidyltransferase
MNAHAAARERWLAHALGVLTATEGVAAVELVGSLGRGDGDDWSDVDLLVFVDDDVRSSLDAVLPRLGDVALVLDAPHNTRADGHSFGAVFLVDGLPLATDWYVWPRALHGRPFDDLQAEGPRGVLPEVTDDRRRLHEQMMTVVDVKRFARGANDVTIDDLCFRAARAPEALATALARMIDLADGAR